MPARRFTDKEEDQIASIYKSGKSARAIARIYRCDKLAITSALRRTETPQRSPSERNRLYSYDVHAFDVITPESAYWWGFIYADGHVYRNTLVVFLAERDRDHLRKLSKFLNSNKPIRNLFDSRGYPQVELDLSDIDMAARLRELGIVTGRTRFASAINILPENCINHFIRGIFDGDGSIDFRKSNGQPRLRICGESDQIQWISERITDQTEHIYRTYRHKGTTYVEANGRIVVSNIVKFLYRDATVFMDRKRVLGMKTLITPNNARK